MIKLYTVECPVHGRYEVTERSGDCPTRCIQPTLFHEVCGEPLKRIYDAPAVHYKGSGWASKDK